MKWAFAVAIVAAGLEIGGCQSDGGPGGYAYTPAPRPYVPPPPVIRHDDSPSVHSLSGGARQALKDGCRDRYPDNNRKYRACLNGQRHSEDALAVGCAERYAGDGKKIRRCMQGGW